MFAVKKGTSAHERGHFIASWITTSSSEGQEQDARNVIAHLNGCLVGIFSQQPSISTAVLGMNASDKAVPFYPAKMFGSPLLLMMNSIRLLSIGIL